MQRPQKLDITKLVHTVRLPVWARVASSAKLLNTFISISFLLLLVTTVYVQQVSGVESIYLAEKNVTSQHLLNPARGLFYDRDGNTLVMNRESFSLVVNTGDYDRVMLEDLLDIVSQVKPLDKDTIVAKFEAVDDTQVLLINGLTNTERIALIDLLADFPHYILSDSIRQYLYAEQFSHILGYTGVANAEDVAVGYGARDILGKYRLEKDLDERLRGIKGQVISRGGNQQVIPELPGENVFLTIDKDWQNKLYEILGEQVAWTGAVSGAAVILDIADGDVLASVGFPSFDANLFAGGISGENYQNLLTDERKPLVDKVISSQASPGSSFKFITSFGLLQNGTIDEGTHYFSTGCMQISAGFPFCEYGKYYLGDLDIRRALTRSSNIFFCESILKLSSELGYDQFANTIKQLGVGEQTGINLEGEVAGVLASPTYKQEVYGQNWFGGDACNAVIGQGFTLVTPIQMANALATILNGGSYFKPNVIEHIEDQLGNVVEVRQPELARQVPIDPKTIQLISEGMWGTVNSPQGTAYRYLHNSPGNFIAKTGSAETFRNVNGQLIPGVHGWIVGAFDYGGHKYSFAVHMAYGGGGWNAVQVMQKFAKCLFSDFTPQCQN